MRDTLNKIQRWKIQGVTHLTLENIKKLNRYVSRINLDDLEEKYDDDVIKVLSNNIDIFKSDAYYIERSLMSMKLFDKLHPVLNQYIKKVDWESLGKSIDELINELEENIAQVKESSEYDRLVERKEVIKQNIMKYGSAPASILFFIGRK